MRALILHGWKGRIDKGWPKWLAAELEERGIEVEPVQMESEEDPGREVVERWAKVVAEKARPDDVLVGHSMGCMVLLRYLSDLSPEADFAGMVLVAGGLWGELDTERVKRLVRRRICVFSDNDEKIPMERTEALVGAIEADPWLIPGQGHFDNDDPAAAGVLEAVLGCYSASA